MGLQRAGMHNSSKYVRRRGRLTRGQSRALRELSGRYVLDSEAIPAHWHAAFGRAAPLGVEIGFGMGHALLAWAREAPHLNLVGIELYEPGIGHILREIRAQVLENIRILQAEATQAVETGFERGTLAEIRIFFPDPWPKQKHRKRRLIQPAFVEMLAERLAPGGLLLLATDWEDYAKHMLAVCDALEVLENCHDGFAPRAMRPTTHFEVRGRGRGHDVWDLAYRRQNG